MYKLTNSNLFESLTDVNNIDIHNDYDVKGINILNNKVLEIILVAVKTKETIKINFENIIIIELELPIRIDLTIDNFYRGRYELNDRLYDEYEGKKCFYIEFCEEGHLELLTTEVYIITTN